MNLGLLDLLAPLLNLADAILESAHLPTILRIAAYATVCAWIGMHLYRRYSDQVRLAQLRADVLRTQRSMALHDGDFASLRALIRLNFKLSLRQLAVTLRPALLASLPLLLVLPWLSNRFDFQSPAPETSVRVCTSPVPAAATLHWQIGSSATRVDGGCWRLLWPGVKGEAALFDEHGTLLYNLSPTLQSSIIHKFTYFNWLIGNPDGYLLDAAPLDSISIALPARELIGSGASWLRGWEVWYFGTLLIVSLILKWRWRLH